MTASKLYSLMRSMASRQLIAVSVRCPEAPEVVRHRLADVPIVVHHQQRAVIIHKSPSAETSIMYGGCTAAGIPRRNAERPCEKFETGGRTKRKPPNLSGHQDRSAGGGGGTTGRWRRPGVEASAFPGRNRAGGAEFAAMESDRPQQGGPRSTPAARTSPS